MTTYEIEYSPEALRDLDDIFTDVLTASCNIEVTHDYLDGLQDKVEAMAFRPQTGTPLFYEELFTGYYSVRYKEYLVFYRVNDTKLFVDRILFRKSDYISKLLGYLKD